MNHIPYGTKYDNILYYLKNFNKFVNYLKVEVDNINTNKKNALIQNLYIIDEALNNIKNEIYEDIENGKED